MKTVYTNSTHSVFTAKIVRKPYYNYDVDYGHDPIQDGYTHMIVVCDSNGDELGNGHCGSFRYLKDLIENSIAKCIKDLAQ